MALIEFPARLDYLTAHQNFWLQGASVGVPGLDGREQVVFSENRVWTGQIDLVPALGDDLILARSIGTKLRGRSNRLRVPVDNRGTFRVLGTRAEFWASVGLTAEDIERGHIQFDHEVSYADGSGFALPDTDEPKLTSTLPAGSTSVVLDSFLGRNLVIGARFSIEDFLYEVTDNQSGHVNYDPPLRRGAAVGTTVEISQPFIQVRLSSDDGWKLFSQFGRLSAEMTVNVVEAFDR